MGLLNFIRKTRSHNRRYKAFISNPDRLFSAGRSIARSDRKRGYGFFNDRMKSRKGLPKNILF